MPPRAAKAENVPASIPLKDELTHHQTYQTRDDAEREIISFIEGFYNRQRLRQSLDYLSPLDFARQISDL